MREIMGNKIKRNNEYKKIIEKRQRFKIACSRNWKTVDYRDREFY